jgi:formylglycine-generating enzyme required for sulfatase activity
MNPIRFILFALVGLVPCACSQAPGTASRGAPASAAALEAPPAPSASAPRIALVIGNSSYPSGPLTNPVNDAKLMADTLTSLGFEVVLRRNADQPAMKRAIEEFGERLEKAGSDAVGLFYYAGHGVQLSGRNYLIPTTAHIEREGDVEIEAVSADWVLEQMRYARNRLNILILDACRNNPFTRSWRSASGGLAGMRAPAGIYIAYSTAPDEVAADGSGRNSPYTEALARAMRDAEPIEEVFKRTRIAVMAATADKQTPYDVSELTGDFYFTPPKAVPAPAPAPAPAPTSVAVSPPVPSAPPAPAAVPTSVTAPASPRVPPTNTLVANAPVAAPPVVDSGPPVPAARALQLLERLGVTPTGLANGTATYPRSAVRQLLQTAPRHVRLGSTPEQIEAAFELCQQHSPDCERSWYSDESVRSATLQPFTLDATPVSVGAFRHYADSAHYRTEAETLGYAYALVDGNLQPVSGGSWRNGVKRYPATDDSPVVGVSFRDAQAYCRAQSGRLPSEDEWEYVTRGPERRTFGWGEDATVAATRGAPPLVREGPAQGIGGAYRGLTGTVWQWVDSEVDGRRVLKGGSWLEANPANKRAAVRRYELPQRADADSGFRCARSALAWPDAELWLAQLR